MLSKQISVFIENREGRLGEVLGVLKDSNVDIQSLSLADTSDYGLLRIIVDKPEEGSKALKEKGFSAMVSDVLILEIKHEVGSLQKLMEKIANAGVNIEYMYGLSLHGETASIIIKTSNPQKVEEIIKNID